MSLFSYEPVSEGLMDLPTNWKSWPEERKRALLTRLRYDWRLYARPDQLPPPGDWHVWLLLAGRGAGKTRAGAEFVKTYAIENPGVRVGIICPTYGQVRDVALEGESGLLAVVPAEEIAKYNRSLHQVTFVNGSLIAGFSGSDPERLRGPQHHLLWCEELAAWPHLQQTWDMAQFGLRLGKAPRAVVTTTPRPLPLVKEFIKRESPTDVVITRASTFDNAANLPASQLKELRRRYGGTYLGAQELMGLVIDDVTGALWTRQMIESARVDTDHVPKLQRVVIGVDPAGASRADSDETGIVAVGRGVDGHAYVLADRTLRGTPDVWGKAAVELLREFDGDRIVAERNFGGEMVVHTIRTVDAFVPVKAVWASKGKDIRAEPVSALYEQGRVHHIGLFAKLEDEMTTWIPYDKRFPSPNRIDALVWAMTELKLTQGGGGMVVATPGPAGAGSLRIPRL